MVCNVLGCSGMMHDGMYLLGCSRMMYHGMYVLGCSRMMYHGMYCIRLQSYVVSWYVLYFKLSFGLLILVELLTITA